LLRRRRVGRGIDVIVSLTTILAKKMPAAFRRPASFTIGASAASV
jgi:hypothetical protein